MTDWKAKLKQAKELFDEGLMTQEKYDQIQDQAYRGMGLYQDDSTEQPVQVEEKSERIPTNKPGFSNCSQCHKEVKSTQLLFTQKGKCCAECAARFNQNSKERAVGVGGWLIGAIALIAFGYMYMRGQNAIQEKEQKAGTSSAMTSMPKSGKSLDTMTPEELGLATGKLFCDWYSLAENSGYKAPDAVALQEQLKVYEQKMTEHYGKDRSLATKAYESVVNHCKD